MNKASYDVIVTPMSLIIMYTRYKLLTLLYFVRLFLHKVIIFCLHEVLLKFNIETDGQSPIWSMQEKLTALYLSFSGGRKPCNHTVADQ